MGCAGSHILPLWGPRARSLQCSPWSCPDKKKTLYGVDSGVDPPTPSLRGNPGGCTAQPTPAFNLARSKCLGESPSGVGTGRENPWPQPGEAQA